MRNVESHYLADLFAVSMRWLMLFGLALSMGINGELTTDGGAINLIAILILALPVLWNGFFSVLAIFNQRIVFHRQISLAFDILFTLALFIITGGLRSSVSWATLLPLFTGALYFGAPGSLFTILFISLSQAAYTYISAREYLYSQAFWMIVGFNIIVGILVTLLSVPLIDKLRQTYQRTIAQRQESERKAQQQERDRMKALFEMIETFSATLNYQKVMDYALDTAISAADERDRSQNGMVGAVLLFGNQSDLEIRAERGFQAHDRQVHLPAEEGILSEVFKTGELSLIKEPGQDPELARLLTLHDRAVSVCLPLIRGITAYGVMLFAHEDPDYFSTERVEILQMLSNQAVISLQNANLYQDLAKEKERILQTQEEAQRNLSRALHDGPTQSISAIAMRISIARKILEQSPQEVGEELARVEEMARRATQDIRHMLFTMRPLVLETEGLTAALHAMADKMGDLHQQKVIIDVHDDAIQQLSPSQQSAIFSITEESVNNARKHAKANAIWVKLQLLPQDCSIAALDIIDNGVGFDVKSVMTNYDRRGSLGMINLQERTDLINGILQIDSIKDQGTRIRILIPIDHAAADRLHHLR